MNILPIFSSHYSQSAQSCLTLEERGKSKGPKSIVDLAIDAGLKEVYLVDDKIDGFIEAYKNLSKEKIDLRFGLKLTICADANDKSDESIKTESKVIVFIRNTKGYSDLIRISNYAWTTGFYYTGRIDWKTLKEKWTDNLLLALPFFSSFAAVNTLTFASIVPDLPSKPTIFREIDSVLPFASLIDEALDVFNKDKQYPEQKVKSIYYATRADFKAYMVYRCIAERSTFSKPEIDHLASDHFSFEDWRKHAGV